jgi:predicted membrane chloride channel (bestrophin family)
VACKTREQHWRALSSQWRYFHSLFAYLGPPSHLLWRIKLPLVANLAVAALAILNSLLSLTPLAGADAVAATTLTWRLSTFTLALLLTFRVGRSYERWWIARQAFGGVGSAAVNVATMVVIWVADPQLKVGRWARARSRGLP